MGKITYWLRKLGILRTSNYTAKNMEELNEATATNGGMIQGQKEIDEKYKPEENDNNTETETNNQPTTDDQPADNE